MKREFRPVIAALVAGALLVAIAFVSCRKTENPSPDEALSEDAAAEEEKAEEEKPAPKPEPKVTDDLYVEITARSIIIRDKSADDPDQAEADIEKLYEQYRVTAADVRAFGQALAPPRSGEIQRKIQEKLQDLLKGGR